MDGGGMNYSRDENSPNVLFEHYRGRRSATINALTIDVEIFSQLCDPEKKNMCLYGHPNGAWELIYPTDDLPPDIPEPVIGINCSRDGTEYNEWLLFIATHTDSWLLSVSFFYAARFGYDQRERMELFDMINEHPTVREAVIQYHMEKKESSEGEKGDDETMEDEGDGEKCPACGKNKGGGEEFWVRCAGCKTYFHYNCVKMTRSKGRQKKIYKCPDCN